MNSKISGTSDPHRLLINFTDKINLKRSDKYVALSKKYKNIKKIKKSYKNNKFKISAPTWNEEFEYLMDHILYQIFKTILSISSKNMRQLLKILHNDIRS